MIVSDQTRDIPSLSYTLNMASRGLCSEFSAESNVTMVMFIRSIWNPKSFLVRCPFKQFSIPETRARYIADFSTRSTTVMSAEQRSKMEQQ